jgi:hypothetical protein
MSIFDDLDDLWHDSGLADLISEAKEQVRDLKESVSEQFDDVKESVKDVVSK